MMRVFLTGGTGSIGRRVARRLLDRGDEVVILSRRQADAWRMPELRGASVISGDPSTEGDWAREVDGCDAVVNLAGHNIFGKRWSSEVKREIRDSRVRGTENVVSAIGRANRPPRVLVQASAIGFYGPHGDEELTEASPPGSDFLARVCREWEDAAHPAEGLGARVAWMRIGLVLAAGEGTLGTMVPIFRWGGAAPVGGGSGPLSPGRGTAWMSWIHVDDLVALILRSLDDPGVRGPINGTAPHPVRNAEFSQALAKVLHRPMLPLGPPKLVLRLLLGEVAEVITQGQRVIPERALSLGFAYQFRELATALDDLLGRVSKKPRPEPATHPSHA